MMRCTRENFIQRASEIHGDTFDYSKAEYVNMHTKVCIICPVHGEFWQTPHKHLYGRGCHYCANNHKKTTEQFVEEAKDVHGDAYDYSKVEYKSMHTKVCIICPQHGEFWQTPHNHIHHKDRCPLCFGTHLYTTEEFIEKARQVHHDLYDYDQVNYKTSASPVAITCKRHGIFYQKPNSHLRGKGCPFCQTSRMENNIANKLTLDVFEYKRQYSNKWLGKQTLDFYLPEYNAAIECQGIQHFKEVAHFGGCDGFEKCNKRDKKKKQLCEEHNVKLFYYGVLTEYDEFLGEKVYHDINELINDIRQCRI